MRSSIAMAVLAGILAGSAGLAPLEGASHLWTVNEIFSNADGTIQFIELYNPTSVNTETGLATKWVRSDATGNQYTFTANLPPTTAFRSLLLATAGFAALPGAPVPDYIIPDNFFSTTADSIEYWFYDTATFPNPMLPLDGINSLHVSPTTGAITIGPNSPKNYAGVEGSIDASPPPEAPENLAYGSPSPTYIVGVAIAANTPTWRGGTPDLFEVDPALPGGLGIDPGTGWITGTPLAALAASPFDITASNAQGASTTTITITIDAAPPSPTWRRGDSNQNGTVEIADAVQTLGYLFQSIPNSCVIALDSNDDGGADLADAIHVLAYLFSGGPTPGAPFGTCGLDPTPGGSLSCILHAACP